MVDIFTMTAEVQVTPVHVHFLGTDLPLPHRKYRHTIPHINTLTTCTMVCKSFVSEKKLKIWWCPIKI